jgi:alkaline phosphatase D
MPLPKRSGGNTDTTFTARRRFLLLGGATLAGFTVSSSGFANFAPHYLRRQSRNPFPLTADPFSLGIAAGAPTPDGFMLWTRLAPDPLGLDPDRPGGITRADHAAGIPVDFDIATDPEMRRIVASGTAYAEAAFGFSVHQPVAGLAPARPYWYRFHLGDAASPVGRAMTLPRIGAAADTLRLGFAACANYERGHFAAYRHLADEQPDMTLFLGDYIYEQVEAHRPVIRRHSDNAVPKDLDAFRRRYAQYRLDPDLQALHAGTMTLATWDDHEVENDYAGACSENFTPAADFLALRRAAYQAFYEHFPLRHRPTEAGLRVHDSVTYGDLLRLSLLDGRQYRDAGACYGKPDRGGGHLADSATCAELLAPARSMLGAAQEQWLAGNLTHSPARWNLIAQNVIMAQQSLPADDGRLIAWTDAWDGYPMARERLLAAASQARNPVVFSGDIHSFWQNDLIPVGAKHPVASEFVVSSVTSDGPPESHLAQQKQRYPHVRFATSRHRGYALAEITGGEMTTHFRTISDVVDPQATRGTLASFVLEDGQSGAVAV